MNQATLNLHPAVARSNQDGANVEFLHAIAEVAN